MTEPQLNPGHTSTRNALRVLGPIIGVIGLGLVVVSLVSFFSAFGGSDPPKYFWCAFVGIPLMFVGGVMTMYGYMGKVMRYGAQETAPVVKDTFNYMAKGTSEGIRTTASALGQGLREGGFGVGSQTMVRCHKCNALVPEGAKFCSQCGQTLGKSKPCPRCKEVNDPDAKFCDNCGYAYT